MELLRQEEDYVAHFAEQLYGETATANESGLSLNINRLQNAHIVLASRVVLSALYGVLGPHIRIARTHVDAAIRLIHSDKPSGSVTLPGNVLLRRRYRELLISRQQPEAKETFHQIEIVAPGIYEFCGARIRIRLSARYRLDPKGSDGIRKAVFDAKIASFPLVLRGMLPGDRFKPWGIDGSRKLKKTFIDLKIPRDRRRSIPLLVKDGEILWVAGIRRGQGASVTERTSEVLELEIV
jgi:tRNA(Ile)-lysidine synthase